MQLSVDEQAVVDLIQTETVAFWSKDVAGFDACHLHAPYTRRWGFWQHGGIMVREGWEEIGRRSALYMDSLPRPIPEFANGAGMSQLNLRVLGDMAWMTFVRDFPRLKGVLTGALPNGSIHELVIFERHDGVWKIVLLGVLDAYLGDETVVQVAADGTALWRSEDAAAMLVDDDHFVVRGGKLRLRDRRLDARLQAAIHWAARLDTGLMSARGAMPLVIDAAGAEPRVCWVMADAGMILVMLEDKRPLADRLAYAARVFDLSPAQARLCAAIVEGQTLAEFGRATQVSVNTARTHLRRIFDKVGVRTQPALVRVLLSLSAPR